MGIRSKNIDKLRGKDTHCGMWLQQLIFNPLTEFVTSYVAAVEPSAVGVRQQHTIAAQPDRPRNLRCTMVDANASITVIKYEIYGKDFWNNEVSEIGTRAGASSSIDLNVAFRSLTSVFTTVLSGTVGAGVDTIAFTNGGKLGLAAKITKTTDVLSVLEGDLEGGADPMATDAAAISPVFHTFDPTQPTNGIKDYVVEILSTLGTEELWK